MKKDENKELVQLGGWKSASFIMIYLSFSSSHIFLASFSSNVGLPTHEETSNEGLSTSTVLIARRVHNIEGKISESSSIQMANH